jgi:hypothetical protein
MNHAFPGSVPKKAQNWRGLSPPQQEEARGKRIGLHRDRPQKTENSGFRGAQIGEIRIFSQLLLNPGFLHGVTEQCQPPAFPAPPKENPPKTWPWRTKLLSVASIFFVSVLPVLPVRDAAAAAPTPPSVLAQFLEEHCLNCHEGETKKGDLDLASLSFDLGNSETFLKWVHVFDRVTGKEMPPPKRTQPREKVRSEFLDALKGALRTSDLAREKSVGRVNARRLTRAELEHSLQDVLGIESPFQARLPEDILTAGFSTVADGQQVSSNQLQTVLEVIDTALEDAFAQAQMERDGWKKTFTWQDLQRNPTGSVNSARGPEGRPSHQDVVSWNVNRTNDFYGRLEKTKVPAAGRYRIRVEAFAVNAPKGERVCASLFGGEHVSTSPERYLIGAIEAAETPAAYEFFAWMEKGDLLKVRVADGTLPKRGALKHPQNREVIEDLDGKGYVGIAVRAVELERTDHQPDRTWSRLFGHLPRAPVAAATGKIPQSKNQPAPGQRVPFSKNPNEDLQILVQAFANRAFRRPVKPDEIEGHLRLAKSELRSGASFPEALRAAYRGILLSPKFLYLDEAPGPLSAHALASRLSFFLWSAPPDDELRASADSGRLLDSRVLFAQTERLLAAPYASRFVEGFTDHWLKLREIDATTPDEKLYEEFDDLLKAAMLEETRAFFLDLVRNDRGVRNLADSQHTFVNNRLAKHYGLPPLAKPGTQQVPLPQGTHRGGLLTHASVLKVTANGTTTSPVTRGIWVLEKILGQHVGAPPPNVPAIEPDIRGAKTIREQLEKHRAEENCAVCHRKIDPPGFVLENYDVIGGWRTNYRAVSGKGARKEGPRVDASYQLPDGHGYKDLESLKSALLQHPESLARTLVWNLATYSTGATPSFADRERIAQVVSAAKTRDYGVRTLIHALIQNPLFKNK